MTSQLADDIFHVDCQRPPVPGCGDTHGNELLTASKSSVNSDASHSFSSVTDTPQPTSFTVTSLVSHKSCLLQEPDGCSSNVALCPEICEPGMSKMDGLVRLLNDRHGVTYFRQFLSTKHACDILEFWLACVGYQKINADKSSSFALVIYKTYIASVNRVRLAGTTRRAIKERLKSGNVDHSVFDAAVAEVETVLLRDYYPLFLESYDYTEYIRTRSANQSPSSDGSSGHSSNYSQLQTVETDDCQHRDVERLCCDSFSAGKTAENPKTCNPVSSSIDSAGDCLAQTGYVVVQLSFCTSVNTCCCCCYFFFIMLRSQKPGL